MQYDSNQRNLDSKSENMPVKTDMEKRSQMGKISHVRGKHTAKLIELFDGLGKQSVGPISESLSLSCDSLSSVQSLVQEEISVDDRNNNLHSIKNVSCDHDKALPEFRNEEGMEDSPHRDNNNVQKVSSQNIELDTAEENTLVASSEPIAPVSQLIQAFSGKTVENLGQKDKRSVDAKAKQHSSSESDSEVSNTHVAKGYQTSEERVTGKVASAVTHEKGNHLVRLRRGAESPIDQSDVSSCDSLSDLSDDESEPVILKMRTQVSLDPSLGDSEAAESIVTIAVPDAKGSNPILRDEVLIHRTRSSSLRSNPDSASESSHSTSRTSSLRSNADTNSGDLLLGNSRIFYTGREPDSNTSRPLV